VVDAAKFYGNRLRGFGVSGFPPSPQTPFPIINAHRPYNSVSTTVLHCDDNDGFADLSLATENCKSLLADFIMRPFFGRITGSACPSVCSSVCLSAVLLTTQKLKGTKTEALGARLMYFSSYI